MKLTKRQLHQITNLINESLDEIDVGTSGLEHRVNDEVINQTVDVSPVSAQMEEIVETAVIEMYDKLPSLIRHLFQSNGMKDMSPDQVNQAINYNGQVEESQHMFMEELNVKFREHVAEIAHIVLHDENEF